MNKVEHCGAFESEKWDAESHARYVKSTSK